MSRMVVLDRDGTINVDRHYLSDPEQLEFLPGAVEGIKRLNRLAIPVVVITNQSAIARGYFDEGALHRVHERLAELLAAEGASVDRIYYCPHGPDDACACRKPRPGLLVQAASEFGAEPSRSFVVGDKASDVELGRAVGATSILVRTGYGETAARSSNPDYCVAGLREAAELIETLVAREP